MRRLVLLGLVLFGILLLPPVSVAANRLMITSKTLRNPVTIDGKWTYASEWTDGAASAAGPKGWFVIKDDPSFLYVLVDHTKDISPTSADFGWVVWDQRNDGGKSPNSDDYDLILTYTGKASYTSSVARGTGDGWGSFVPASSLGILSASSTNATLDPYSKTTHLIYEFQVPRSIVDNSTAIATIGFFAGAQGESSSIFCPLGGDYRVPDTWAELTFSLPVPEFPSVLVIIVVSVAVVVFVLRKRIQSPRK